MALAFSFHRVKSGQLLFLLGSILVGSLRAAEKPPLPHEMMGVANGCFVESVVFLDHWHEVFGEEAWARMVQWGAKEDEEVVARRDGADAPAEKLDYPDAAWRIRSALANPNAGELLVSAAEGWELEDLGGRHHAGGGSHGSLVAGDSLVPLVTVGLRAEPRRIVEVAPALLEHFGVPVPGSMEALAGVG